MPVSGARTVLMWSLVLLRMACLALNSARRDPIQGVNIYRQLDEWKLERSEHRGSVGAVSGHVLTTGDAAARSRLLYYTVCGCGARTTGLKGF